MDASKKIIVAMRIIVFDFELFIGEQSEILGAGSFFRPPAP
jgi:hypothetical protein